MLSVAMINELLLKTNIHFYIILHLFYAPTGELPYRCDVEGCCKAFRQMSSLKQHLKIHSHAVKMMFNNKHLFFVFQLLNSVRNDLLYLCY